MSTIKKAAIAIACMRYGSVASPGDRGALYLAVSHPTDPTSFAFPGGGVEEGEDPAQAALRELAEETGHQGGHTPRLIRVYQHGEIQCFAFEVLVGSSVRSRRAGERGVVAWVPEETLRAGYYGRAVATTLRDLRMIVRKDGLLFG